MFKRIAAVITFAFACVWFSKVQAWNSASTLIGATLAYVAVEIENHRIEKKKAQKSGDLPGNAPDDLQDKIDALGDIRAMIGQVNADKQPFPERTQTRTILEHVQKDLKRIFERIQHKFGVSDRDAPR
jgi:hypothetical protein